MQRRFISTSKTRHLLDVCLLKGLIFSLEWYRINKFSFLGRCLAHNWTTDNRATKNHSDNKFVTFRISLLNKLSFYGEAICSKFGKQDKNKIRCFRVKTTVLFMIIVLKTINLLTKLCKKQWGML